MPAAYYICNLRVCSVLYLLYDYRGFEHQLGTIPTVPTLLSFTFCIHDPAFPIFLLFSGPCSGPPAPVVSANGYHPRAFPHIPVHWPSLFYDIEVTLTQPRMETKVWSAWVSACLLRNGVDRNGARTISFPTHIIDTRRRKA